MFFLFDALTVAAAGFIGGMVYGESRAYKHSARIMNEQITKSLLQTDPSYGLEPVNVKK